MSSPGIFLSYRRADSAGYARLLQVELRNRFANANVFMDLTSIEAGVDFVEAIREAVEASAVLVALIGHQWTTIIDKQGRRRLDNPHDYVRFELRAALERGVQIIPVLVDEAKPLREDELPADLRTLARLNAFALSNSRYDHDSNLLFDLIQRVMDKASGTSVTHQSASAGNADVRFHRSALGHMAGKKPIRNGDLPGVPAPDRDPRRRVSSIPPPPPPDVAYSPRRRFFAALRSGHRPSPDLATTSPGAEAQPAILTHETPIRSSFSDRDAPFAPVTVAFSPDGQLLASGGANGTVLLWNPATAQVVRTVTGHERKISAVAFSPDGRVLASSGDDGKVRLWDPVTGRPLRALTVTTSKVYSVAFSPDGRLLATGGDGNAQLWNVATGGRLHTLSNLTSQVQSVAFSPDGRFLASTSDIPPTMVQLWDPATGEQLTSLDHDHRDERAAVYSVAFSPDGQLIAGGDFYGKVLLWNSVTGEQLLMLTSGASVVWSSVTFSPDGRRLASSGPRPRPLPHSARNTGSRGAVDLWDSVTGHRLDTLTGPAGDVCSIAFSPDGQLLAGGSTDGVIQLWRLNAASPVQGP